MQKGYSREIMEELFKEEKKRQEEEQAKEAAKQKLKQKADVNYKFELILSKLEQAEEEIQHLHKKISRLRVLAIAAIMIAVVAAAIGLNESLKELMYYMP